MTHLHNEDGATIDLVDEYNRAGNMLPDKDWVNVPAILVVEDTDGRRYAFRYRGCKATTAFHILWPLFSNDSNKAEPHGSKFVRVVAA